MTIKALKQYPLDVYIVFTCRKIGPVLQAIMCLCLCLNPPLYAQEVYLPGTVALDSVLITGKRASGTVYLTQTLDTVLATQLGGQALGHMLQLQNVMQVRHYGPHMLASPGMRGTSAAQTSVFWYGINLQSSLHGQVDLNLFPLAVFDKISVRSGGDGAQMGTGAVGGSLQLGQSELASKSEFKVGVLGGSFGMYAAHARYTWVFKHIRLRQGLYYQTAKNDFTYIHPNTNERLRSDESSYIQSGYYADAAIIVSKRLTLDIHYWWQNALRQIPPALNMLSQQESQSDYSHRAAILSKYTRDGKSTLFGKMAFFTENIGYENVELGRFVNYAQHYFSELNYNRSTQVGIFQATAQYQWAMAGGDNLQSIETIRRPSLVFQYQKDIPLLALHLQAACRKQWDTRSQIPILPSITLSRWFWEQRLGARLHSSAVYRLPTFNDWYWFGGTSAGNPSLVPETGWSHNLSLLWRYTHRIIDMEFDGTPYLMHVYNRITWITQPDGRLQPDNIAQVQHFGVENRALIRWKAQTNVHTWIEAKYDFTQAKVLASNQEVHVGTQLIYVPYDMGYVTLGAQWRTIRILYTSNYTGFRYTSQDNASFLPAYTVSNVQITYSRAIKNITGSLYTGVQNIWNESYMVLAGRPMPLRQVNVGIQCQL